MFCHPFPIYNTSHGLKINKVSIIIGEKQASPYIDPNAASEYERNRTSFQPPPTMPPVLPTASELLN